MGLPRELTTLTKANLTAIALSKDGRVLVASDQQVGRAFAGVNTISCWNAQTLAPLPPLTRPITRAPRGSDDGTLSVAVSPLGRFAGYASFGGSYSVYDRKTQTTLWKKMGLADSLRFSPDGKWLALNDGTYKIFDSHTGALVESWRTSPEPGGTAFCFSSKGGFFASVAGRPAWKKWSANPNVSGGEMVSRRVKDWKILRTYGLPNTDVIAIAPDFSIDGVIAGASRIYSTQGFGFLGSRLRCFGFLSGRLLWEIDSRKAGVDRDFRSISDLCFSPRGEVLAVLPNQPSKIWLLDQNTGAIKRTLRVPSNQQPNCVLPGGLAFSPDGTRLFARGKNAVLVWDLN